jgi:hypothetical protein
MREKVEREGVGVHGAVRGSGGKSNEFIQNIDQISTSFYFTNFPEDLKSGDLWEVFAKFGHVVDVYIPFKVDKRGKRFGFVKFKDVLDVDCGGDEQELGGCLVWFFQTSYQSLAFWKK